MISSVKKGVSIFGAGFAGLQAYKFLTQLKIPVLTIFDNDPEKWGKKFGEVEIVSPGEIPELAPQIDYIVIASVHQNEIIQQLKKIGFNRIVCMTVPNREDKAIPENVKQVKNEPGPEELKGNSKYRELHKGKRCFIVCNGPSVQKQNLKLLKNEICFFVSSGYLHKDYSLIKPLYHCNAPLPFSFKLTEDIADQWLQQMDQSIGSAELFLDIADEPFIRSKGLFKNRKVNYISSRGGFQKNCSEVPDLSGIIPAFQSVSVMALMVAMYMGFSRIYLLGVEHDSFITGQYRHFYFKNPEYKNMDAAVKDDGKVVSIYEDLQACALLWKQYRCLKNIGKINQIQIYNSTEGGLLDEFERVPFETLF